MEALGPLPPEDCKLRPRFHLDEIRRSSQDSLSPHQASVVSVEALFILHQFAFSVESKSYGASARTILFSWRSQDIDSL